MYTKPDGEEGSPAWFQRREYLLIALLGLLYLALIRKYSGFELDNIWFLNFSHSFWVDHLQTDTFMLKPFPAGMGGVAGFGKLAAVIQGVTLNLVGWSLTNAILISIAFTLLSLVLFAQTCSCLGYSGNFTLCYIAFLGFTEPFVAVSQRARYEFLAIFLLSLALWLAARNKPILAIFVAALATEIEPAAIVITCATATFLFSSNIRSKAFRMPALLLRIFWGAAAAMVVYLLLHPHIVSLFQSADWVSLKQQPASASWPGGFVAAYYIVYRRHLPELVLLFAAIAAFLLPRNRHLLLEWPALCTLVIVVAATILRWANTSYFCFIAPFLCFFILQAFYSDRYRNWILAAILFFTLPQYAWRYRIWSSRHAALSQHDQNEIGAAIARAATAIGKPPEELHLLGNYTVWFAHPHLFVNLNRLIVNPSMLHDADVILCFDEPVNPPSRQEISCPELNSADYRQIESMALRNNQFRLLRPIR